MASRNTMELPRELRERIHKEAQENDAIYRRRSPETLDLSAIHYGHAKMLEWAFERLGDVTEAKVLDIGIGDGYSSVRLALAGAQVTGIEVSGAALERAGELAQRYSVSLDLRQMPGERLGFEDKSFDRILCVSAFHHMDLERAASEFARVLKPGGRAVLIEPLISNPPACLYRRIGRIFSREATSEERPLRIRDMKILARNFTQVEWRGMFFFSIVLFGIDRLWKGKNRTIHQVTKAAFPRVHWFDCWLLRWFPILQRIAWKIGVVAVR
jgi:SAM-dependent methyltransferase